MAIVWHLCIRAQFSTLPEICLLPHLHLSPPLAPAPVSLLSSSFLGLKTRKPVQVQDEDKDDDKEED
jgi:hypothetical protein